MDLNHNAMTDDLDKQMAEVYQHESRETIIVRSVLEVALTQQASLLHDPTVRWGIAYKDADTNNYHIVSPYYIGIVAQEEDLVIQRGWKRLEQLTVFMLRHVSCCISNNKAKSTPLRIQSETKDFINQCDIGEVTSSRIQRKLLLYLWQMDIPLLIQW